jgi:hypothetical protein
MADQSQSTVLSTISEPITAGLPTVMAILDGMDTKPSFTPNTLYHIHSDSVNIFQIRPWQ